MTNVYQSVQESLYAKGHLDDPTDYFVNSIPLHEVYGIRATIINGTFSMTVAFARTSQVNRYESTQAAGEKFFAYVEDNAATIESSYDASVTISHHDDWSSLRVMKKVRNSFAPMVESGGISQEVCDFISNAYRNGISMTLAGVTGSGKTSFLNKLIESNQDGKETVILSAFQEMVFNTDYRRLVQVTGETGDLLAGVLALDCPRIILDEYYPGNDVLDALFTGHPENQFIYTSYHSPTSLATGEEKGSSAIRIKGEHNVQLRIDLTIERGGTQENRIYVPTVAGVHEIVNADGQYSLRTLFSGHKVIHEPTPALARKMGLTQS